MRHTPDIITQLTPNQILVVPTNEQGIHGKGLALVAKNIFGLEQGIGWGYSGQCFALPTRKVVRYKPKIWLETLTLFEIESYVDKLYELVSNDPNREYVVPLIGCGNAGYEPEQVRYMWGRFKSLPNVILPKEFH